MRMTGIIVMIWTLLIESTSRFTFRELMRISLFGTINTASDMSVDDAYTFYLTNCSSYLSVSM